MDASKINLGGMNLGQFASLGAQQGNDAAAERRSRGTARFVALALLAVLVIHALQRLLGSDPWVVQLSDDAFYQFAVAKNLASGQGFTVDGFGSAQGVQPLWPLLLTPFAYVFGSGALPFLATLLGLGLLLLSGLLAIRLLERFVPFELAVALGLLYVSRPGVVLFATNGQETALVFVVLFAWALTALPAPHGPSVRPWRGELLLTLLLPWVRTDLIVLPLALALWSLITQFSGLERGRWQRPLIFGLLSLGLYVVLQQALFAAPLPPSGWAIPGMMQGVFWASEPDLGAVIERYWWFTRPLLLGDPYGYVALAFGATASWIVLSPLARVRRWLPLVLVLALSFVAGETAVPMFGALLLFVAPSMPQRLWRSPMLRGFAGGWIAFAAVAALHLVVRQYPRDYYFAIAALPGLLGLAYLLQHLYRGEGLLQLVPEARRKQLVWMLIALLAIFDLGRQTPRFEWQLENEFVAELTPRLLGALIDREPLRHAGNLDKAPVPLPPTAPGEVLPQETVPLASFNSGILSWRYPLPVVNLDGVADGEVLPHAREGRILQWLQELDVPLIVDTPRQLEDEDPDPRFPHASGKRLGPKGYLGLVPIATFDLLGVGGRHAGTDVQLLATYAGSNIPALAAEPRLLGEYRGDPIAVIPTQLLEGVPPVIRTGTRERILSFDHSVKLAPLVVFRLPVESGTLIRGRELLLEW